MTPPKSIDEILKELWDDGCNSGIITSDDEKLDDFQSRAILHAKKQIGKIQEKEKHEEYTKGLKQGVWLYAWWKDGVQYVGTSGKTYIQAITEIDSKEGAALKKSLGEEEE